MNKDELIRIFKSEIEYTTLYLGQLNRPGMAETDAFMLETIQKIQES